MNTELQLALEAVVISVRDGEPQLLTLCEAMHPELPSAPLDLERHKTFEAGIREILSRQTGIAVGYAEQLYSFGDDSRRVSASIRPVSVTYLALVREFLSPTRGEWRDVYEFLPWEDWRASAPAVLQTIKSQLVAWANTEERAERVRLSFGLDGCVFDHEQVLERYELLWEAALVAENPNCLEGLGRQMMGDDRRMLASALGRLRGKLKYRPVVFELLPESFTMLRLQNTVEALIGGRLHKQNFRRLLELAGLLEPTGERLVEQRGRPAELFRFRHIWRRERPAPGVKISSNRLNSL